ncbi:hypothetical protein KU6B_56140 (plasmid) [Mameliella alba]|nr:hypothetical protein KU6B_56140 [Mameliella alba]
MHRFDFQVRRIGKQLAHLVYQPRDGRVGRLETDIGMRDSSSSDQPESRKNAPSGVGWMATRGVAA